MVEYFVIHLLILFWSVGHDNTCSQWYADKLAFLCYFLMHSVLKFMQKVIRGVIMSRCCEKKS